MLVKMFVSRLFFIGNSLMIMDLRKGEWIRKWFNVCICILKCWIIIGLVKDWDIVIIVV